MTTSWAYATRGQWAAALQSHVSGTLLAVAAAMLAATLLAAAVRGRRPLRQPGDAATISLLAVAAATLIDVPKDTIPAAKPSCPAAPCLAVSRTTGFQSRAGVNRGLVRVPQDGRLVSWSVALGKPGKKQITFFDDKLGGESQAQITVLRAGSKLRFRTVAQGEPDADTPPQTTEPEPAKENET